MDLKYKSFIKNIEYYFGIKLKWYQKLKLFIMDKKYKEGVEDMNKKNLNLIIEKLENYKYDEICLSYDEEDGYLLSVTGIEINKYCQCCPADYEFHVVKEGWHLGELVVEISIELDKLIKNNKITKKRKQG